MSSPEAIVIRDLEISDIPIVVPLWQLGFYEMSPFGYERIMHNPISRGVCALLCFLIYVLTSSPTWRVGLLCLPVLLWFPPSGLRIMQFFMWRNILSMSNKEMTAETIPAKWQQAGSSAFVVAEVGGEGEDAGGTVAAPHEIILQPHDVG